MNNRDPHSLAGSRLDLHLLELFEAVYSTRNLTAAAAKLNLTQPTVSRRLAQLRAAYNDPLFVRHQRGVLPTPFADSLVEPLASALNTIRATVHKTTFAPERASRTFRIAMSDVGEWLLLPSFLAHLAKVAPNISVEVATPPRNRLFEELELGQVDLAVGFITTNKQAYRRALFKEEFVYIVRRNHPLVKQKLHREQLREIGHVVAGPESMAHAYAVERVLASNRVKARIVLRVPSFLCAGPIVANTDLISAMPRNLAETLANMMPLRLIAAPAAFPSFDVAVVWHRRYHKSPENEWLRETIMKLFRGDLWKKHWVQKLR